MKPVARSFRLEIPAILLIISAFLTPVIGGQLAIETESLSGGIVAALTAAFSGSELPTFSHFLIGFLVTGAFVFLWATRRVIQVPANLITAGVFLFVTLIWASVLTSNFKAISTLVAVEWTTYFVGFLAVVGAVGRKAGPHSVIGAIFGGCSVLALKGIAEYSANKVIDPTWRIFAGWNNPNALAVMLLVGFFLGLGQLLTRQRIVSLICGLLTALIGLAIVLTQSKGALLVLAIGTILFFILTLTSVPKESRAPTAIRQLALFGTLAVLVFLLQHQPPSASTGITPALPVASTGRDSTGGSSAGGNSLATPNEVKPASNALSRITNAGGTVEQSAGFRKLLWKTSLSLIAANPAGYGAGTFRFESGRPGLTTQTVYAHSSYLQLAVEGSILLPSALIFTLGIWYLKVFRGFRKIPSNQKILLFSVVAAVSGILGHSFVDSDMYYFGVGSSLLTLMAVGLLLSSDSVAPEFLIPTIRRTAIGFSLLLLAVFGHSAYVEALRADAHASILGQKVDEARSTLEEIHSLAPGDGESWYLHAQVAKSNEESIRYATQAVQCSPNTRNLRLLARFETAGSHFGSALADYNQALTLDPNNLSTLYQLSQLYRQNGDQESYTKTLRKLVSVEDKTYFKIRSLPELIPTETYQARVELAKVVTDTNEQIMLYSGAVNGFKEYLEKTVPSVVRTSKMDPPQPYAGITLEQAKGVLTMASEAAQRLAELDRAKGDLPGATAADAASATFLGGIK